VSPFDDDDETPGPVVVRRAAYDAGMKLEAEVKAGDIPAFETARSEAAKYREAVDSGNAARLTRPSAWWRPPFYCGVQST
jgi:hypothetical protein